LTLGLRLTTIMRMETSDEALATAAANGDAQAFDLLTSRHYDRLFRFAWRLTGTRHDAEDLAHDILCALPAKLASFRGDAKFTSWLYRITLNANTDRARKSQSYTRAQRGWGEDQHRRAAEAQDTRDALDWLTHTMTALPPELRETVALILGEELTQKDAAQVLGLSEGTIAWRMSQVKTHLKTIAHQEPRS